MNLDELKTMWLEYDNRLQATEKINQKVITSIIRARSVSRIARIQQRYRNLIGLFLFYSVCFIFLFIGNPFDYTRTFEFVPPVLLTVSCVVLVFILFKARLGLNRIELDGMNLQEALEKIIMVHVKYKQILNYSVGLVQASSLMIIFPFCRVD